MAYQQKTAFKGIQCHRQGLSGGQVKVIGGFIEQEQIGLLPNQHGQYQARPLAAAQGANGLLSQFVWKMEAAQKIPQLLLSSLRADLFGQSNHVSQGRFVQGQDIQFLLGKIPDGESFAFGSLPSQQR